MLEILLASDNPAQQNGRIDRRHLRIPHSRAAIYIRPVIEESSVIGQLFPEESERGQSTRSCRCEGDPAVFLSEAQGCQAETSGRNASHNALIINFEVASVRHEACFCISLLPRSQLIA